MFTEIDIVQSELYGLLKSRLVTQSAISSRLHDIGRFDWNATITEWLTHFDGLEQFFDDEDEVLPCNQVLQALEKLSTDSQITDALLADTLAHLDFLNMRVKHSATNERWNPLHQSLIDFLHDDPTPIVYFWEAPWPVAKEIAEWLIASAKNIPSENIRT